MNDANAIAPENEELVGVDSKNLTQIVARF